jgi:hypothetical protein
MERIPWRRPRGALHDLAHWREIDEGARSLLLLSDRTLYVLQNLAAIDVAARARWIASSNEAGYLAPEPGSDDDDDFLAAVQLIQEELIVATPLVQLYQGIYAQTLGVGSGAGGNIVIDTLAPDAGQLWHYENVCVNRDTGTPQVCTVSLREADGTFVQMLWTDTLPVGNWKPIPLSITVPEERILRAVFYNCGAGETLQFNTWATVLADL